MAASDSVGDMLDEPPVELSAYSTTPERTVITEPGNCEAWIATDYTVTCER